MDPELVRMQEEAAQERLDVRLVHECVRNAMWNGHLVSHLPDEVLAADIVEGTGAFDSDPARALAAVKAWRAGAGR